jgi:hypothetical protein
MAWISQVKVVDSRTNFKEKGNGKCEREMTVSFAPGELKAEDSKQIGLYFRQFGELVKCGVDEALGFTSEVREPPKGKAEEPSEPATEKQVKFLQKLAGERVKEVLEHYEVQKLSDLRIDQASEAISKLKGAK